MAVVYSGLPLSRHCEHGPSGSRLYFPVDVFGRCAFDPGGTTHPSLRLLLSVGHVRYLDAGGEWSLVRTHTYA